jgi:amino acid adenylation domain-containing protein/thioester reductase-like protein
MTSPITSNPHNYDDLLERALKATGDNMNNDINNKFDFDTLCLQDLFIQQAKRTPDAIAVVDSQNNIQLTYRQLDDVTDRLAVRLVETYNVQPDSVVAILLPRSVQYVIAYVAILKAGGAYMPLELVYPKQLLDRAVTETECNVVMTNSTFEHRIVDNEGGVPCFVLEDQDPFLSPCPDTDHIPYPPPSYTHPHADHLAFGVMSSGTTGTPKGILQTHRAAVHSYLDRYKRYPYVDFEQDRIGAGVFFVWELVRPLCFGATCVVIPDHVLFDPPAVTKHIQEEGITRVLFTPSLLQLILDSLDDDTIRSRLHGLRYLWLCGEVVSTDLAVQFAKLLPHVELMNLYSISECHDVSIGDLKRELDLTRKYATCGSAIPGVKFYVVDLEEGSDDGDDASNTNKGTGMKLVKDGESGEVYVGGPVVGRGYLNMPEKTAERFVTNPFSDDPTCPRLYRTGDLGRILHPKADSNGNAPPPQLEILGRCDFMVKIRGYSVVLGAVETALAKHPKLSSSVVLAVGDEGSRDKKLVAYVVPVNWNDPPSASSVRAFLKDHLPPYAVPSTFCVIDALPVAATAAGKLDRKKLPSHETAKRLRAFSDDFGDIAKENAGNGNANVTMTSETSKLASISRLAPKDETEQAILKIWSDLLDMAPEELSVLDNFFEVGGHSLLATKLVNLVNRHFDKTTENGGITIMTVVEAPTVRDMADQIMNATDSSIAAPSTVDLQAEAASLDPSIYPFPTRKSNTISRFRIESSALVHPRVVFLTGGTGYLGAHILANLLQVPGLTTVCLARAKNDDAAKKRLVETMKKYQLLEPTLKALRESDQENPAKQSSDADNGGEDFLDSHLIAVAGDLSKPLLGMEELQFKSLALEIDSIIHCGAEVNLIKPYKSLKASNVLGTQEILRLATTNGFIKTKVKPVHYISTNGIFPVDRAAYGKDDGDSSTVYLKEDMDVDDFATYLSEGYAQTKYVAEQMCTVAESRGLPISVLRPGNMAGSTLTGVSNADDLNYLLLRGILDAGCAPIVGTNFYMDLTPVDFAAEAVTQLVVQSPHTVIGQRMHLQSPHKPVALAEVVAWLKEMGKAIEGVTREEWMERISTTNEQLSSGWISFEKYFEAYSWLEMDSNNLQHALKGSSVECPAFDKDLLEKWFPATPVSQKQV